MSDTAPLRQELLTLYEGLPPQLRAAAHWIIEHSSEVALLSMRDQARRAGVPPSTMTRLAQRLGLSGYDAMRQLYAEDLRREHDGFSQKAGALRARRNAGGEDALAADLIDAAAARIGGLRDGDGLAQLAEAARLMIAARHRFVIGQRAGFSVAYQLAYVCTLAGCETRLLDQPGGIGLDQLRDAGAGDVLVAVSVHPYTRATVEIAGYALGRGIRLIAITDSTISPLARKADVTVLIGVESPSFFHMMGAAFSAAEIIAALVAAGLGERASEALARSEAQFAALDTYMLPRPIRSPAQPGRAQRSATAGVVTSGVATDAADTSAAVSGTGAA